MIYEYDDIEKQILFDLGNEMQASIDTDILFTLLVQELGWTRYEVPKTIDNNHAIDMQYWAKEHCCEQYKHNGRTWVFESSKDATMFILKWS